MLLLKAPNPNSTMPKSTSIMQLLKTKMSKLTLVYLLLAWLLLSASQHRYSTKVLVQAIESVELKVRPGQSGSRSRTGKVWPTWIERKKIRKTPSGPNPVGNHHPPSRY